MKKIYLMAGALLLSLGMNAQTLKFTMGGKDVEAGSTQYCNDGKIDEYPGTGAQWAFDAHICVVGDKTGSVTVIGENMSGGNIGLCFGGQCEQAPRVEKTSTVTANVPLDAQFEYLGMELGENVTVPKNVITELTAQYDDTPESLIKLTVIFNSDEQGGTVSVYEQGETLTSVNGALEYSVEGTAELALYTTDGSKVISQTVYGNGSISTANLTKGVYVYSLGTKSGKVIVK